MEIYTYLDGCTYLVTRRENVRTAIEVYLCTNVETMTSGHETLRSDATAAHIALVRAFNAAVATIGKVAPGLKIVLSNSFRDWNGGYLDRARWRWGGVAIRPVKIVEEYEDGELAEVTIDYDSRPDPERDKIAEEILRIVGGAVQDALIAAEEKASAGINP
jgi:hypothetical protein